MLSRWFFDLPERHCKWNSRRQESKKIRRMFSGMEANIIFTAVSAGVILSFRSHSRVVPIREIIQHIAPKRVLRAVLVGALIKQVFPLHLPQPRGGRLEAEHVRFKRVAVKDPRHEIVLIPEMIVKRGRRDPRRARARDPARRSRPHGGHPPQQADAVR